MSGDNHNQAGAVRRLSDGEARIFLAAPVQVAWTRADGCDNYAHRGTCVDFGCTTPCDQCKGRGEVSS